MKRSVGGLKSLGRTCVGEGLPHVDREKMPNAACLGLNYKSPTFKADLAKIADERPIDVFFDNVGGEILDLALPHMVTHGRIAICGAISAYNDDGVVQLKNYFQIIALRLALRGFSVHDFANDEVKREEFMQAMLGSDILTADGGLQDTIASGRFEDIPRIWLRLFEGSNQGKLITKLEK